MDENDLQKIKSEAADAINSARDAAGLEVAVQSYLGKTETRPGFSLICDTGSGGQVGHGG